MASCGADNNEPAEFFGENKSDGNVASCLCSDLLSDSLGVLLKDEKPYTGNCFLNYPNSDKKYIEKQIVNGAVNGFITYFDQAGDVLYKEQYQKGNKLLNFDIEQIRCPCSELSKNKDDDKYYYKGQIFKGDCYSLFPDSEQPYIEITYAKGVREGNTKYFNKQGDLLYTELYEAGALDKVIYPSKN